VGCLILARRNHSPSQKNHVAIGFFFNTKRKSEDRTPQRGVPHQQSCFCGKQVTRTRTVPKQITH